MKTKKPTDIVNLNIKTVRGLRMEYNIATLGNGTTMKDEIAAHMRRYVKREAKNPLADHTIS